MHFYLYKDKHWRPNPQDLNRGIMNADLAKWIRQNVSSYSFSSEIGYDRKRIATLEIIIPIPEQAMLFKLTWY